MDEPAADERRLSRAVALVNRRRGRRDLVVAVGLPSILRRPAGLA